MTLPLHAAITAHFMKAKLLPSLSPHRGIVAGGMTLIVVLLTISALQIWQRRTGTIAESMKYAEHYAAIMAEHTSQTSKSAVLVLESIPVSAQESGIGSGQVLWDQSGSNPGTGLGLALVKEIMEIHHGGVALQSKFGIGTTITLWLPVKAAVEGGRSYTEQSCKPNNTTAEINS